MGPVTGGLDERSGPSTKGGVTRRSHYTTHGRGPFCMTLVWHTLMEHDGTALGIL